MKKYLIVTLLSFFLMSCTFEDKTQKTEPEAPTTIEENTEANNTENEVEDVDPLDSEAEAELINDLEELLKMAEEGESPDLLEE